MKHIALYLFANPVASIILLMLCVAAAAAFSLLSFDEARFALVAICVLAFLIGNIAKRHEDDKQRAHAAQKITYLSDYRQKKGDSEQ